MHPLLETYGHDKKKGFYFLKSPSPYVPDKKCPLNFPLLQYEEEFSFFKDYFLPGSFWEKMRTKFNDQRLTVKDIGISSRVLNHWAKNKMLPEGTVSDDPEWKRFSFIEFIWLELIVKMREFGLPLKTIARAKGWIMQRNKDDSSYPWLELNIALAQISYYDPYVIVLSDGTAEVATSFEIERMKPFIKKWPHYLAISLKSILLEIGLDNIPKAKVMNFLSENEKEVVKELKGDENKEIKIKKSNGKLREIETLKTSKQTNDLKELISGLKEPSFYGQATIRYESGKKQSVEIKERKRLK